MLFNSYIFVYGFLPVTLAGVFAIYQSFGLKPAKIWLVICSLFFYAWLGKSWIFLLVGSTLFNFYLAKLIHKKSGPHQRFLLIVGILTNIGLLAYFKYRSEFIFGINIFFDQSLTLPEIILPLAISFYSFHQVAYLVDIYLKRINAENNLTDYLLFISFFPHLIAGPIIYYREIQPQFQDKTLFVPNRENLMTGFYLFAIGLLKKTCIADPIGSWVDTGYSHSSHLNQGESIALAYLFALQIYFDFSAYCDMALGLARLFNIKFPMNFNSPYKATDLQEFWQRWHITLARFFRDYVYIPLGGNRQSFKRQQWNILVVMALSGLWHGSNWLFLLWGIMHGVGMVILQLWRRTGIVLHRYISQLLTINFFVLSLVIFRSTNWEQAETLYRKIFSWGNHDWILRKEYFIEGTSPFLWLLFSYHEKDVATSLIVSLSIFFGYLICFITPNAFEISTKSYSDKYFWLKLGAILTFGLMMVSEHAPFIYFQF